MGCDIHFFTEVRKKGKWQMVGDIIPSIHGCLSDCHIPAFLKPGYKTPKKADPNNDDSEVERESLYSDRNYFLFGLLAGVRDNDLQPISTPKGVPRNASKEYKTIVRNWGDDGHSHSYLMLNQLINYDWTQYRTKMITMPLYKWFHWSRWKKIEKELPHYDEYISADLLYQEILLSEYEATKLLLDFESQTKNKSYQEFLDLVKDFGLKPKEERIEGTSNYNKFVKFPLREYYYHLVGNFWTETMPRLCSLGSPNNVRIVFFFDN